MKHEVLMICPSWKQYRIYKRSQKSLTDSVPRKMLKAILSFQFLEDCLNLLSSPDHLVFIWVTEKFTEECKEYMKQLGYEYDQYLIWYRPKWKPGSSGKVFEYLLVYHKGILPSRKIIFPDPLKSPFTGLVKNRTQKPKDAYAMIETIFPGSARLQVFGHIRRPGWNVFNHNKKNKKIDCI